MKKMMLYMIVPCLAASPSIYADSTALNQHLGTYAELNIGTNLYYSAFLTSVGHYNSAGIEGLGASASLGYNFTNIFALETGFMQNYAKFSNSSNHTNVPYLTTRFNVPIGERFGFIGKLGAMYLSSPHDGGIVLPYVGVGGSYALTKKLDIQVQYQGAVYGVAGVGLLSTGLTYHFG